MNKQPASLLHTRVFIKKALLAISLVLFFNLFFFHVAGTVSFALESLGLFLFVAGAFYSRKIVFSMFGTFVFLLFSCFVILSRANSFTSFIEEVFIGTTLLFFTYIASNHIPFVRSLLELILSPLNCLFSYIKSLAYTSTRVIPHQIKTFLRVQNEKQKIVVQIFVGLCIGLPLVVLLVSMFAQADPIYSSFVNKLFQPWIVERIVWHVIYSVLLFVFLLPIGLITQRKAFTSPLSFLSRYSLVHEMTIVMSLIVLALASFLIIQWPYIFAQVPFETHLSQFGVATYSEYVRKGFGELLKIALFLYGVIWLGLIFLRNKKQGQKTILPVIQTIVLAEFLVFNVSVFRRIWLYQAYHGWSLIRIYGGFLLLWITGITLFLAARHFWHKKYVVVEALFTGVLIVSFGLLNVEQFIAQTHPPTVNNRIDYTYLARMSPDGYTGWKQAFDYEDRLLLHSNLDEKKTLEKDDRREIAYAGIIIRQLTRNYQTLLLEYGADEEIKAYYKSILLFQKKAQVATIDALIHSRIKSIEALRRIGVDYKSVQEDYDIRNSEQNIQSIEKLLTKIDKKDVNLTEIENRVPLPSQAYTSSTTRPVMSFFIVYDTSYNPKTPRLEKDRLSFLYQWNYSRQQAYRNMKQDMPYQKLFELQKKYFELNEKIYNQPEGQRDYDFDISFDTPFLDPL